MKIILKPILFLSFVLSTYFVNAEIIYTSDTAVEPGVTSYLAVGDDSILGGYPTPFNLPVEAVEQAVFKSTDDIRIATQIDLAALSVVDNMPNEHLSNDLLEWSTYFYHWDIIGEEWVEQMFWTAYASWDDIALWQANPELTSLSFWTGSMFEFLDGGTWDSGNWLALSAFEGDFENSAISTHFSVVSEPLHIFFIFAALFAFVARRRLQ